MSEQSAEEGFGAQKRRIKGNTAKKTTKQISVSFEARPMNHRTSTRPLCAVYSAHTDTDSVATHVLRVFQRIVAQVMHTQTRVLCKYGHGHFLATMYYAPHI